LFLSVDPNKLYYHLSLLYIYIIVTEMLDSIHQTDHLLSSTTSLQYSPTHHHVSGGTGCDGGDGEDNLYDDMIVAIEPTVDDDEEDHHGDDNDDEGDDDDLYGDLSVIKDGGVGDDDGNYDSITIDKTTAKVSSSITTTTPSDSSSFLHLNKTIDDVTNPSSILSDSNSSSHHHHNSNIALHDSHSNSHSHTDNSSKLDALLNIEGHNPLSSFDLQIPPYLQQVLFNSLSIYSIPSIHFMHHLFILIYSSSHLSIYSSTLSFVHHVSCIYSSTHLFIYTSTFICINISMHLYIFSFIYLIYLSINSYIYLFIHLI